MIVLYKGRRGAGKTLTGTKDAMLLNQAGWDVYTNMQSLKFGIPLSVEELLVLVDNDEIRDCVLFIDEIQTLIDSRRSMANVEVNYFIQQIRKRNIILLATTQFAHTVDKVFRSHVDVEAEPRILLFDALIDEELYEFQIVAVHYLDVTTVYDGGDIKERYVWYDPVDVFGLYDTEEKIQSAIQHKKKKKKKQVEQ